MYWLIGLFLSETIIEGFLSAGWLIAAMPFRRISAVLLLCILAVTSVGLAAYDWRIWLWLLPFSGYRGVNLYRMYRARLAPAHMRTVAFRAYGWLVAFQAVVCVLAFFVTQYAIATTFLDTVVALQLLCAVILLRASMHTWRHASVLGGATALTDAELPSLSVLIPARNETDDLERCLQALVASDYPKLEIIVLDDCSANRRTPDIIRSFAHDGVRFIAGEAPDEERWLAKNYAYQRLAEAASGDILLFCGVDALYGPASLRKLVSVMLGRQKTMMSVMPLRAPGEAHTSSLLQAMRYYWEICLPRRLFKRPPVLSTCWLIQAETLAAMGGFESVSRSISPESLFARRTVITDGYSFIRSDAELAVSSDKSVSEQYATSLRVRYPQLHRRLELVALAACFEVVFLLGPFIGLACAFLLIHTMAYVAIWLVSLFCLYVTYGLVTIGARLASSGTGWVFMPIACLVDLAMLHISLWRYEFGTVDWKGRNVCIPVMQLPDAKRTSKLARPR